MDILKDIIGFLNGFRKWTVMFSLIFLGAWFRIKGYISGQELVDLLKSTTIAFMSFNGIEHMTSAIGRWMDSKERRK